MLQNEKQLKTILFLVFTAAANYVSLLLSVIVSGDLPHRYLVVNEAEHFANSPERYLHSTVAAGSLPLYDLGKKATASMPSNNASRDASLMDIQPRAFPSRPLDKFPCFLEDPKKRWWEVSKNSSSPLQEGFFFLKTHKTGSSTGAGIHLRIAQRVAARKTNKQSMDASTRKHGNATLPSTTNFPMCRSQFDHSTARKMKYASRRPETSFLWSILRDPTERAISQFFHFEVSRRMVEPTEENFQNFLLSKRARTNGYYLRTLSFRDFPTNKTALKQARIVSKIVQEIIDGYNFIAIMERMNESAVVLQMLLGLSTIDILYLNAKGSGGYDAGGYQGKCTHLKPKNVTLAMRQFLHESPLWQARIKWDEVLYQAANESLDMTIQALGKQNFQRELRKFENALEQAQLQCANKVTFPCSLDRDGASPLLRDQTDCLWKDSGCGGQCLDSVSNSLAEL